MGDWKEGRPIYSLEEAINILESINGMPFSEQQRAILTNQNGIKIVACAGSGKTHTIVNLVTLRIMTGVIKDPSRLLLTTYSKAGADNMADRINALLKRVGLGSVFVTVKTLHAIYYNLLMYFNQGKTLKILSDAERLALLRQATRDEKLFLEEEDLGKLNTLFSYQLNNLINDIDELYNSYVYDLNISQESYRRVYKRFAELKRESQEYDFDDLQYTAYDYLTFHDTFMKDKELQKDPKAIQKNYGSELAIKYLHDSYDYIYVDEFQDTSQIQYEILKKMLKDERKFIVVGDEDQCLPVGTEIITDRGAVRIEDVKIGDRILSARPNEMCYKPVTHINRMFSTTLLYEIKTARGFTVQATREHIAFAYPDCKAVYKALVRYSKGRYKVVESNYKDLIGLGEVWLLPEGIYPIEEIKEEEALELLEDKGVMKEYQSCPIGLGRQDVFEGYNFIDMPFCHLQKGFIIPVYDREQNKIVVDTITEIVKKPYIGMVYDLSIAETQRFVANNILVHNCIYSWRGAKSSILLNVDSDYHIDKLNLDTNYRCRETILEYAKLGIVYTSNRDPKNMKAAKSGGKVSFMYMDSKNLYSMTKKTAELIEAKIKVDGVSPSDIAVLVRNNAHAQVLQAMLGLQGIYCSFTGEMKLSAQKEFKDVETLLGFCIGEQRSYYDKYACMSILWKVVRYLGGDRAAQISEIMSNTKANFVDIIGEIICTLELDPTVQAKLVLNPQIKSRISYYCKSIKKDTANDLLNLYRLLKEEDATKKFTGLLKQYKTGTEFLYGPVQKGKQTIYQEFNKKRNHDCILNFFIDLSKNGVDYIASALDKIAMYESTMTGVLQNGVRITTMHSAKGLEWSHVIIMAYDNVSFPDVSYLLKKKDMNEIDVQEYLDGERRLAYVAITRAIDDLTIVTDCNNMSLFGLESLGGIKPNFNLMDFAAYVVNHNYEVPDKYKVTPNFTQFLINKKE